jgi:hypothetical protein
MMMEGPDYCDPVVETIKTEKVCVEYALITAGSRLAQEFARFKNSLFDEALRTLTTND